MNSLDAFFGGSRYAIFGVRARGRVHGPVLVAALKKAGKEAVVIDPHRNEFHGARVVRSLADAGRVDGVVMLPPAPWDGEAERFTRDALGQCRAAGIPRVWLYAVDAGDGIRAIAAELGVECIGQVCPCLHIQGAGFPHNLHRWLLRLAGRIGTRSTEA